MTCNTSAVAVCCSKASRVSVNSRAFSIAITALRREILQKRDLFVRERPDLLPVASDQTEKRAVFAQW